MGTNNGVSMSEQAPVVAPVVPVAEQPNAEPVAQLNEAPKKMYKVKVNGVEAEVDEQELITAYQVRKASDERFREGNLRKKQAEEFVNLLRTNPMKVLSNPNLGIDMRKLAEDYLIQQMEEESLSPEQKELREAKSKLQQFEEEKKAIETEREQAAAQELRQRHTENYTKDITQALETSGLPRTEHTVKRMAYYMYQALLKGYDLSASDVADLVKQDYINEHKSLFGGIDGEMLLKLLGDDVANKIRKHDVSKIKNIEKQLSRPNQSNQEGVSKAPSKKMTKDEWKAKLEEMKK